MGVIDLNHTKMTEQLVKEGLTELQVGHNYRLATRVLLFEKRKERRVSFGVLDNCRDAYMFDTLAEEVDDAGFAVGAVPLRHKEQCPCERNQGEYKQ